MSTVKVRAGEYRVLGAGGADMGHVVKRGRCWVATDATGDYVGDFPTLKAAIRPVVMSSALKANGSTVRVLKPRGAGRRGVVKPLSGRAARRQNRAA
jgi:hypothetical protein